MTRTPIHLLQIVDRMSMAHSLESSPTFIDYKIVEYVTALPAYMKLKGRNLKYPLNKVASRYLPRELIYRDKQGFGFPLGELMRTDLKRFINNLFSEFRFIKQNVFNNSSVNILLGKHLGGRADDNFRFWILINLELWHRYYFENATVESLRGVTDRERQNHIRDNM